MSVKIAVLGSTRRQGETTIAILLAQAFERVFKTKVCLTKTGQDVTTLRTFLGIKTTFDFTRSVSQLVRLAEAGTLSDKEIADYVTSISPNVDFLETCGNGITDSESAQLLMNSFGFLTHNFVITDVDTELDDEITQKVLEAADLVVIVISQGKDILLKLMEWMKNPLFPNPDKVVYVVNEYDPVVGALRELSKLIGVPHVRVAKLNYNPFVKIMGNLGQLQDIMDYVFKKDSRVIDLYSDIREIIYMCCAQIGLAVNWPGGSR